MNDVLNLIDTFKGEGVNTYVAVDKEGYEDFKEVYDEHVYEVDIPDYLPKMGYSRDQSVTWFKEPIIGSMAIDLRRGEEKIIIDIYRELGLEPIYSFAFGYLDGRIMMSKMEGGNFIMISDSENHHLFTGVGVRGSNLATFQNLDLILDDRIKVFGVPISAYINDWESGAVHLDVVMMYTSRDMGLILVDPSRMGLYSFLEYKGVDKGFIVRNGFEVFKELDLNVLEPPSEKASRITMVNALNLGSGKMVVDSFNRSTNRYLEKIGLDIIEVDIPHIEAGGGGVRCATREIWV